MPNGILVSSDGSRLYVAEIDPYNLANMGIMMYPILSPGEVGLGSRIHQDVANDGWGPDGMTMDEHGNLYGAFIFPNYIIVFDPDGQEIGRISVPELPTNCVFGGTARQTLYITAGTSLYSIETKVRGAPLKPLAPSTPSVVGRSPTGSGATAEAIARLGFSMSMNRDSVQEGFSVSPSRSGSFEWSNMDRGLTFQPDTPWPLSGELVFRLSGDVRDATGATLDGNRNGISEGSPADDYVWTFTFAAPTLTSFRPSYGMAGSRITLSGRNMSAVTNVAFNGVEADFNLGSRYPDTSAIATVPEQATTGPITIESPAGSFTTAELFYVSSKPPPSITVGKQDASSITLRWPASAEVVLETRADLTAAIWSPVTNDVSVVGDHYELAIEPELSQRFYRLSPP